MRRIAILVFSLGLAFAALAAGSDEQYLDIYNEILQADSLQSGGQGPAAALRYLQAQNDLLKLQSEHPTWNPDIVKFRLDYLTEQLQKLAKFMPTTNAAPAPASPAAQAGTPSTAPSSGVPGVTDLQDQNAKYLDQIRSLTAINEELKAKLKDALSVQPAGVSADDYAKAQEKINALQKEKDLLTVALEQEKANAATAIAAAREEGAKEAAAAAEQKLAAANQELESLRAARAADQANAKQTQEQLNKLLEASSESDKILAAATKELELLKQAQLSGGLAAVPPTVQTQSPENDQLKAALAEVSTDETQIATLKAAVNEAEKKWVAANTELQNLKAAQPATATNTPAQSDEVRALTDERDKLKDELSARSKDLADAEAHHNVELLSVRQALQQSEQRGDDLEKKLAAATTAAAATPAPAPVADANAVKVEQLQARIAVLEANQIPYTSDELAILKLPPSSQAAEAPKPPPEVKHSHSIKDLPPGAGGLWEEAMHATIEKNYDLAEQKFDEVLRQDPTNVYVLAYLANAQFAAGHLEDCEKSVQRALAVDPDDAGSLYILGVLRYRQNRLDDALDAFSLSAKYDPNNAAVQNFLGCVLADKGLRTAAETALRRALQLNPDYAEAHFNLAVVYVGNQPPSLALARWHYRKAMSLGHPRNEQSEKLEKLLSENN